jgi:hypothetical protein
MIAIALHARPVFAADDEANDAAGVVPRPASGAYAVPSAAWAAASRAIGTRKGEQET